MFQTIGSLTNHDTNVSSFNHSWSGNGLIKFGKVINNEIKLDIIELLLVTNPPEEFDYKADIKYLYYKEGKVLGIMAYNLVPMEKVPTPLCVHIIGEPAFSRTKEGYEFLLDTFRDLKKEHKVICTHIPDDRQYIIKPMLRFGFVEYSKDEYGKFYYLDLSKI